MTEGNEVATLRAEVAAVRRQVRGLTILLVLALAGVGVLTVRGQRPGADAVRPGHPALGAPVEAQMYRLLDPDGNLRGLWQCPPAGPALALMDEAGRPAVTLTAGKVGLTLSDGDGQGWLRAATAADGSATLRVGVEGRPAVGLWQGPRGAGLRLTDARGRVLFERP